MSNYKEHVQGGWVAHFGLSIFLIPWLLYFGSDINIVLTVIGLSVPITLFASILPDIDHQYSRTNTLFRYSLFIVTTTTSLTVLVGYRREIQNILLSYKMEFLSDPMIIIVSIIVGCVALIFFKRIRPNHRGLTHSIVFLSGTTALLSLMMWQSSRLLSIHVRELYIVIPLYYVCGILAHLYLDGEIL